MNNIRTKDMPVLMRPYEKFMTSGAYALSDAELLAVIIKSGAPGVSSVELGSHILAAASPDGGVSGLTSISYEQLRAIRGIGHVKALQILSLIELSRRIAKSQAGRRLDFHHPEAIAGYYMEDLRHCRREKMILVLLDTKLRRIADEEISAGTVNASIVSPREIFAAALRKDAVYIVLLHNHPSGDSTPSRNDIEVTERVRQAGQILGIQLIDHIIIGDNRFVSLKSEGLINFNQ